MFLMTLALLPAPMFLSACTAEVAKPPSKVSEPAPKAASAANLTCSTLELAKVP